ncbi:hypothetical protein [Metabacillus litoralis]|nr:hypothetical protein [Metabacillus litoralis]MCM3163746.1 hypothetical protein [Metabacillus litoralis]
MQLDIAAQYYILQNMHFDFAKYKINYYEASLEKVCGFVREKLKMG